MANPKSSSTLRKYKTLPPIRIISSNVLAGGPSEPRPSRAERSAQRESSSRLWPRPAPPRPTRLHLGLSARSHSLLEYQTFFPSLFSTHHIHSSEQSMTPPPGVSEGRPPSANLPPLRHGSEREILTNTLTSIIRSLLDDAQFHASVMNNRDEPVPYFTQLRPAPSPPPPSTGITVEAPGLTAVTGVAEVTGVTEVTEPPLPPTSPSQKRSESPPRVTIAEQAVGETEEDSQNALRKEHQRKIEESIRRLPEFGELVEDVLLNTLQNLMTEAFLGELVLTARPRIIALPPVTPPSSNRKRSMSSRKKSRGSPLMDTVH